MTRATASDAFPGRRAILGTATFTDAEAGVDFYSTPDTGAPRHQAIVRYVDASNYLRAEVSASNRQILIWQRVAGVETLLGYAATPDVRLAWFGVRVVAWASGHVRAQLLRGGHVVVTASGHSVALEAGGALAGGQSGFGDYNPAGAMTRYYDNFYAGIPAAEPIVIHAGQSIEFRSDSTLREDASGTYAGPPPQYVGSRFFVPPAGDAGRKSRVAVIARRNDITESADDNIADSTTVTVYVTPRYLCVPRPS